MRVDFLTPLGGLLAIGSLVTLAAFAVAQARAWRAADLLRLPRQRFRSSLPVAASLAIAPALLGLAAAQPIYQAGHERYVRQGAEAYVVMDTSRSMLASASATSETRFDRAREDASAMRDALAEVPVGIASLTNRLLPHLFPSPEQAAFGSTLDRSIDIERPPPDRANGTQVTTYGPLADLAGQNYFASGATRRLAIVFTDGETRFTAVEALRRALLGRYPAVHMIFVHVGAPGERVFLPNGDPEPEYRADPRSMVKLETIAQRIGGRVYSESRLGEAERAAQALLSGGTRAPLGRDRHSYPLAPYFALACLFPLAVILRRRNL
jgi:hypothetical protein